MYVYFQIRQSFAKPPIENIHVMAVHFGPHVKLEQGGLQYTADVIWHVTAEGIEWVKDRWEERTRGNTPKYGYAFIEAITSGMSTFARALCASLGLQYEAHFESPLREDPSGTIRVPHSEDTSAEG